MSLEHHTCLLVKPESFVHHLHVASHKSRSQGVASVAYHGMLMRINDFDLPSARKPISFFPLCWFVVVALDCLKMLPSILFCFFFFIFLFHVPCS